MRYFQVSKTGSLPVSVELSLRLASNWFVCCFFLLRWISGKTTTKTKKQHSKKATSCELGRIWNSEQSNGIGYWPAKAHSVCGNNLRFYHRINTGKATVHTSIAMPICKLERTDQYLDMYASRIEDHSKTEHSAQYTDTYVSRPPQDRMKRERTDQYTDMYVSRGDERTKLSGGIDCDMYTSCHGEHTELQADMLSPYSGEPMAGRGVPVYNSEHGGPMSGGGLPMYNGEPMSGRGMPVYNGERAEPVAGRGMPVYSGEHGEPTAERGVQLYNGEHGEPATGRGVPVYNGEHGEPATGRGMPVYNGEHGEPTTGRGLPVSQYSGTEREVTSQGAGVSSRPVPYIQVRVGDLSSF